MALVVRTHHFVEKWLMGAVYGPDLNRTVTAKVAKERCIRSAVPNQVSVSGGPRSHIRKVEIPDEWSASLVAAGFTSRSLTTLRK